MGEFAKQAAAISSGWQDALASQEQRMSALAPSSKEVATARAQELIAKYTAIAEELGRKHRQSQQSSIKSLDALQGLPEGPGREYVAQLGAKQADIADYLREKYEDLRKDFLIQKDRLTKTTEDPSTLPWFAPTMALGIPQAFIRGYTGADKELNEAKKKELDTQLGDAKSQFEQALAAEMTAGRKVASVGELIDGLAELHVKQAIFEEGDMSRYLGYYLAAAALLGKGADTVAYNLMKKHDPRRLESSALESAIQERMRAYPTPILIEPPARQVPDKIPGEVNAYPANLEKESSGWARRLSAIEPYYNAAQHKADVLATAATRAKFNPYHNFLQKLYRHGISNLDKDQSSKALQSLIDSQSFADTVTKSNYLDRAQRAFSDLR